MNQRTYGVLLRVYTPKPDEVEDRVERAMGHLQQFLAVQRQFGALSRLAFLVPSDYDCGHTANVLYRRLLAENRQEAVVWSLPGHHSCEVLNGGVRGLQGKETHALIISGKALSYLTPEAMHAIDQAFADGAKVAGLAVDELREVVLSGRLQNTFAAWDVDALLKVGGFDSSIGVEEVTPIAWLVVNHGQCIAPLDSTGGKLDIASSETARARHQEVMMSKINRQLSECVRIGFSFEEISDGILPGYPRPV